MILDLFAGGGGGWDLAARSLGRESVGIEWDGPSCATRAVVGLRTIRADVSTYPAERFAGRVEGLCGSPPCQSFSAAGKGAGLADPRGQMVYEPMRYVRAIGPRWVALEQVPEVLGYWRWMARELRGMGYSAWAGTLNAADYGVPQVRKRAILLAALDRVVQPPAPTHSRLGHADLFGAGLSRWVSMAEALGWGLTTRPGYTLCGDSGRSGGGHHDGGSRQREEIAKHRAAGRWAWPYERPSTTICAGNPGVVNPGGGRAERVDERARVHTGRRRTEPAPTVAMGHDTASWAWERPATIAELGVLQGFPADHPWQPPRRSAQVGNAIPPPLAEACLRSLITGP